MSGNIHVLSQAEEEAELGIYEDNAEGEDLTDDEEVPEKTDKSKDVVDNSEISNKIIPEEATRNEEKPKSILKTSEKQQKVSIATVYDNSKDTSSVTQIGSKRSSNTGVISVSISGKSINRQPAVKGVPQKRSDASTGLHVMEAVASENDKLDNNDDVAVVRENTDYSGVRGKTCTPASMADTEWSEMRDLRVLESRIGLGSRQTTRTLYSRASDQASVVRSQSELGTPTYFYISQRKPTPMPPLKAWRGFHGNVYFEPIHISKTYKPPGHEEGGTPVKRNTPISPQGNSAKYQKRQLTQRKFCILDRRSVLDRKNSRLPEDLQWIEGLENPGSLRTEPIEKKKIHYKKERIHKGSVARNMSKANQSKTSLAVSGDRYAKNQYGPPLMRTQTQYSHSNQRLTTNSPDLTFPPVDQLKMSLRHVEQETGKETILHIIPPAERVKYQTMSIQKPYMKYSPEMPSTARSMHA